MGLRGRWWKYNKTVMPESVIWIPKWIPLFLPWLPHQGLVGIIWYTYGWFCYDGTVTKWPWGLKIGCQVSVQRGSSRSSLWTVGHMQTVLQPLQVHTLWSNGYLDIHSACFGSLLWYYFKVSPWLSCCWLLWVKIFKFSESYSLVPASYGRCS